MPVEYLTVNHIPTKDLIRLFSNIEIHPDVTWNNTPCWIWCGYRIWDGYGRAHINKRAERTHRIFFAWLVHPLPRRGKNGELDHLCKRPSCCNPIHMEFVTHQINIHRSKNACGINAARTHCVNGHEFTADNLVADSYGRRCKTCVRDRMRQYRAANPEHYKAISAKYLSKVGREELRRRERERYHKKKAAVSA